MSLRWMIMLFPVLSVVVISLVVKEHAANAIAAGNAAASVAGAARKLRGYGDS